MDRGIPGDPPAFGETAVFSFMKYIHPRGPKLTNHRSGEGLPDLWLQFSRGNAQQSHTVSDGDSRTFPCTHLPPQAPGLSKAQAWYGTTCVAQNSTVEFLFLKRAENTFLPRSYVTLPLLNARFKLLALCKSAQLHGEWKGYAGWHQPLLSWGNQVWVIIICLIKLSLFFHREMKFFISCHNPEISRAVLNICLQVTGLNLDAGQSKSCR